MALRINFVMIIQLFQNKKKIRKSFLWNKNENYHYLPILSQQYLDQCYFVAVKYLCEASRFQFPAQKLCERIKSILENIFKVPREEKTANYLMESSVLTFRLLSLSWAR